jgi:anti-sigma factor RsiW
MAIETPACRKLSAELTEYLDDALSPARRQGMAEHLSSCPACRSELAGSQRLAQLLGTLPRPRPRPGVLARLTAELGRQRTSS